MKKTAILMINYKDYASKFLEESVLSLRKQTQPFKLFIIDNSSSEKSREYIKKIAPEAELIINEGERINKGNNGYALGINQGIRAAAQQNFDYAVVSNMDTVFEKDWLKNLVETASENKNAGAVQAKIMMFENKNKINSTGNRIHFLGFGYCEDYGVKDFEIKETKKINYASGCSVLYKIDVLKEIGMYDEEFFMYHEDSDLSWRIWQAGYEVILAPKAIVYHKYEFSRSMRQFYFMERNRFLTILSNYKLGTLFLILPAFTIMELGLFAFSIKNKTWKTKLRVYWYFLNPLHWVKLYKNRIIKQSNRKIPDRKIVKQFSGKLEFQEVANPVLKYVANPFFNFYWSIAKNFILW
ncbi:MAG: glycosyltransferase family 2 protein [bacterium]